MEAAGVGVAVVKEASLGEEGGGGEAEEDWRKSGSEVDFQACCWQAQPVPLDVMSVWCRR